MSDSGGVSFRVVSHSQYDTGYLHSSESGCSDCAVDWTKANGISKIASAINAEPYRSLTFREHLPYYNTGLNIRVSSDGQSYDFFFPDPRDDNEKLVFQVTRLLVEAKCAIYAFMSFQIKTLDGSTSSQVIRLFETVETVDAKMNRGNRWMEVAPAVQSGANQLLQWEIDAKEDSDKDVMTAVQRVLVKMVEGIDETMKGVGVVDQGLEHAVQYVSKLSGTLKAHCMQISSMAGKLPPTGQHQYIINWARRVRGAWDGNDLSQLDVFTNAWTRIQSNLITVKTTGPAIQRKFADAIQATKDRAADPKAPTDSDGLHHLYVTLRHTISQTQLWIKAVEGILMINWQFFSGDGIGLNPMEKLFQADIDYVLALPG